MTDEEKLQLKIAEAKAGYDTGVEMGIICVIAGALIAVAGDRESAKIATGTSLLPLVGALVHSVRITRAEKALKKLREAEMGSRKC